MILVSHDRKFLDNVVTQTLAADAGGVWREYVGGYSDWLLQRPSPAAAPLPTPKRATERAKLRTKLSFKEERELAALPQAIEALEREQAEVVARMSTADYHRGAPAQLHADRRRMQQIESLLQEKFARWEALEQERGLARR